jgi:hypothetical protein
VIDTLEITAAGPVRLYVYADGSIKFSAGEP